MTRRSTQFRSLVFTGVALALAGPAAAQVQTTTESGGYMENWDYVYDGRRNDSYQTNVIGVIDGDTVFDLTFQRSIDDSDVRTALAGPLATRGINSGGTPGVLAWEAIELLDFYEEFLDSFTETSYSTVVTVNTTVQVTSGDAPNNIAFIGDRGYCYTWGVSGETNFGDFDGFFADCDSAEEFEVAAGTVNTNTHTTTTVTNRETSFTNEDYLNYGFYRVVGTVTPIGHIHTAVQTGAFEAGANFRSRLLAEGGPRGGAKSGWAAREKEGGMPVRVWAGGHNGEAEDDAMAPIPGNQRAWSGMSGGVVFAPAPGFSLGLAIDRTDSDIDAVGAPESADLELKQIGLHLAWEGEAWFATGAASQGEGDVSSEHGNAALGGVSQASYDMDVIQLAAETGYIFRFGGTHVAPLAGMDWVRVRNSGFVEQGGVALAGKGHDARRTSAWLGLDVGHEWTFAGGRYLQLGGRLRVADTISGEERVLPVTLAGVPGDPLVISGIPDDGEHTALALEAIFGLGEEASLYLLLEGERHDGNDGERLMAGVRIGW